MTPDEDDDVEDRAGEGGADQLDSTPQPHHPGPADGFWVGVLIVIVVLLLLVVLVSHMNWHLADGLPPNDG
ncbi:hypothetical protein [Kitasatospora sp. NPDC085879]|uniref:hypothetical protein n=1 Tax=Kitasatospora sp. NPDC085879 TaxID=3154769 RepID=UPI00343EBB83